MGYVTMIKKGVGMGILMCGGKRRAASIQHASFICAAAALSFLDLDKVRSKALQYTFKSPLTLRQVMIVKSDDKVIV